MKLLQDRLDLEDNVKPNRSEIDLRENRAAGYFRCLI